MMATATRIIVDVLGRSVQEIAARNGIGGGDESSTATPTSTAAPSATTSPAATQSGVGSQSPLLFFVALGFGVVFTNLWIIVGVKYCFRYNARNRALARGEIPEDVQLNEIAAGRPHRRRREKKLMTMDEVNERFPLTKYKNWTSARASAGLPTAGGVTASASRPASLRNVELDGVPSSPVDTKHSIDDRPMTGTSKELPASLPTSLDSTDSTVDKPTEVAEGTHGELHIVDTIDIDPKDAARLSGEDSDDDHIPDAVPVELLDHPGDSCAICIDTLEPDDDIRGLTCGHAFHAGCLDPWLTSRRACCPLCKADYFVPKPKPEGEAAIAAEAERSRRLRLAMPQPTHSPWSVRGNSRLLPIGFNSHSAHPNNGNIVGNQRRDPITGRMSSVAAEHGTIAPVSRNPFRGVHLPAMRWPGRLRGTANAAGTEPTPGQVEEGNVVR